MVAGSPMVAGFAGSPMVAGFEGHGLPSGFAVLVVDDDRTSLKVIERMLIKHDYKVTVCKNSEDALSTLKDESASFDLLITEVHMSGPSGFELISRAKWTLGLTVVSMCADSDPSVMSQALRHGASLHFTKPLTTVTLETIWQQVWRKKLGGNKGKNHLSRKRKIDSDDEDEGNEDEPKKARIIWDYDLHQRFLIAVTLLGDSAAPRKILDLMNVEGLTTKHVSSHLQKHRQRVEKAKQQNDGEILPISVPPYDPSIFPLRVAVPSKDATRTQNLDIVPNFYRMIKPLHPPNGTTHFDQKVTEEQHPPKTVPQTVHVELLQETDNGGSVQRLLYTQMKQAQSIESASMHHQDSGSGSMPLQMLPEVYQPKNQKFFGFGINNLGEKQNWGTNPKSITGNNSSGSSQFPNYVSQVLPDYGSSSGVSPCEGFHYTPGHFNPMQEQAFNITPDSGPLEVKAILHMQEPQNAQYNWKISEISPKHNSSTGSSQGNMACCKIIPEEPQPQMEAILDMQEPQNAQYNWNTFEISSKHNNSTSSSLGNMAGCKIIPEEPQRQKEDNSTIEKLNDQGFDAAEDYPFDDSFLEALCNY